MNRRFQSITLFYIASAVFFTAGCDVILPLQIPDQSQFAPLDAVAASNETVIRLYGETISPVDFVAIHMSFIIKPADTNGFELWELQPGINGPFGHIRFEAAPDVAGIDTYIRDDAWIIAEMTGPDAQAAADFIRSQSPLYPCRFAWELLGPNSNTYIQWVLNQVGWNVPLSPRAIGKDATFFCN